MNTTSQKIFYLIKKYALIEPGDKILIALSGGPDSVFALYFFHKFCGKYKISLGAAHLNHSLRGTKADEDTEFCRELCLKLNINFFQTKLNVREFAAASKISFEEAGRLLRYDYLQKVAQENSFQKIITAHTINDNAETVLLNLIKGTGVSGIAGIPVKRDNIIRPLLNVNKTEILEYLNKNKIEYKIDESNLDTKYQRNFLRKEIIPLLKENLNPSLEETLFYSSEMFRSLKEYIEENKPEGIHGITINKRKIEFPIKNMQKSNKYMFSDSLRNVIRKEFFSEFGFVDFNRILEMESFQTGKTINLRDNLIALRERDKIIIFRQTGDPSINIVIHIGEEKKFNGKTIKITETKKADVVYNDNTMQEYISADGLSEDFILRNWKPGDKFIPLGLKSPKTVSDYLTDKKIPANEKKNQFVLVNNDKIIWLVGLRIDERFRIYETSGRILSLCIR